MSEPFYSFNRYLQELFGERVHRIPIDAGFSCPNIDGYSNRNGCIYCNNKGFVVHDSRGKGITQQIEESIVFYKKRLGVRKFIAYFQAFTNTYADVTTLQKTYDIIKVFPQIVGLCIATRPDCIDNEKIKLIAEYKKDYLVWMEYGLQTTHDRLLKICNRNHCYEDFITALRLTRSYDIASGVHIIIGLPTQTYQECMEDAMRLAQLDIQGIKFHVLHVLRETQLETLYRQQTVKLLEENEYVRMLCDFLERIPPRKVILRLVSSASNEYLIAPLWMNGRHEIKAKVTDEFKKRKTYQGYLCNSVNS
ncbi:MAG: TIGR01212 family radical SAM protein [Candidatus Omnitrophota bacterium]